MTRKGFEYLLLTAGLNVKDRLVGWTVEDSFNYLTSGLTQKEMYDQGLKDRVAQIQEWVKCNNIRHFVVLDDLPLALPELVKCDPETGLTAGNVSQVIHFLGD